mgnify:CR=1 FL=1
MQKNQKLIASDGYEVMLFPLPYMQITQGENGSYSHRGTYNIDFVGYNGSGVITSAPIYAPVTMKVTSYSPSFTGGNAVIFESVNRVHLANGQLDYLTIAFGHDSNPPCTTIGSIVHQGELCYHTGTYGQVTGDHVHTCLGQGVYVGYTTRPGGHMDLTNRIHYWEGVFVNDTTIVQGYGHNWITWDGPIPPTPTEHKEAERHFPWPIAWRRWPGFKRKF